MLQDMKGAVSLLCFLTKKQQMCEELAGQRNLDLGAH